MIKMVETLNFYFRRKEWLETLIFARRLVKASLRSGENFEGVLTGLELEHCDILMKRSKGGTEILIPFHSVEYIQPSGSLSKFLFKQRDEDKKVVNNHVQK